MRIHSDSKKFTAFRKSNETYQWCVAPIGLAGMPGIWSRLMRVLFGKFPFLVVYLYDICIFSISYSEHLGHLATVIPSCAKKTTRTPAKMQVCMHRGQRFGAFSVQKSLFVDNTKTETIAKWSKLSSL